MALKGIGIAASLVDDLEDLRKATENRIRSLTRTEPDKDGVIRSEGIHPLDPQVMAVQGILDGVKAQEKAAIKNLEKQILDSPFGEYVKMRKGIGPKAIGRLLAATGDPYIANQIFLDDDYNVIGSYIFERSLRQFFTYCGYGIASDGNARRRKKGEKANWNSEAKKRVYIISDSAMKQRNSHLREVYDSAKLKYENSEVIDKEGNFVPISDGRRHNRALRAMSKEVLAELYHVAREYHVGIPANLVPEKVLAE